MSLNSLEKGNSAVLAYCQLRTVAIQIGSKTCSAYKAQYSLSTKKYRVITIGSDPCTEGKKAHQEKKFITTFKGGGE